MARPLSNFSTDPAKMTKVVWSTFFVSTLITTIYVILGFSSWRSIRRLAGADSAAFEGCRTTGADWLQLFSGLAWSFAIGLIGVVTYLASFFFLLSCAYKSLSRKRLPVAPAPLLLLKRCLISTRENHEKNRKTQLLSCFRVSLPPRILTDSPLPCSSDQSHLERNFRNFTHMFHTYNTVFFIALKLRMQIR